MGVAERTYINPKVDRAGWPPGPWDGEPDKIQWLDEATGYDCLIVRNRVGSLCGYVGLPPEHPCHGVHCDRVRRGDLDPGPDNIGGWIEVHGGLTYADKCGDGPEDQTICHVPLPGRPDDVWWLGFDTAHCFDLSPGMCCGRAAVSGETYRDVAYVRRETERLAAQLTLATPTPIEDDDA